MKKFALIFLVLMAVVFTDCFSEKKSPFYDSEWIMQNYDNKMQLYYHHLKKIDFDFTECVKFENGEIVGQYTSGAVVKFYQGDFYYSVAELGEDVPEGEESKKRYHMELIRPKNYFYGENKDVFGNPLEEFIKVK